MFFAACYQRDVGSVMIWQPGEYAGWVSRYAIVPALLVLSAALVLLDSSLRDASPRRGPPWPIAMTVVAVAVVIGISFYQGEPAVRGTPSWDVALEEAARACPPHSRESVPAKTSPPGFGVYVPCDKIPESLGGPPSG
jgi:hypothetical protein